MSGVVIKGVSRTFPAVRGGEPVQALAPVDLSVGEGDFVAILGPPAAASPRCCASSPASTGRRPAP